MHKATHQVICTRLQSVIAMLVLVGIASPAVTSLAVTLKHQDDPPKPENVKVIPDGTEFTVVTTEEISSKTAAEVIRFRSRLQKM